MMPVYDDRPVHSFFGLSYANYLVLPRSVMEAMPHWWQEEMVELLNRAGEKFGHLYGPNDYEVRLVSGERNEDGEPECVRPDPLANYRYPISELRNAEVE